MAAYRHIISLASSQKFPKKEVSNHSNLKKLQSSTTQRSFEGPAKRKTRDCPYFQKLESLAYIFVADSMGISSFKFVQLAPKDANFLHQSAFWAFKVIQGR